MANPLHHVDLPPTDPAQAKAFYRELFTWTMDDMQMGPDMTYTMIQPGEGTGGGLMKQPMAGAPSAWLAYVDVDDVKASNEKVRSPSPLRACQPALRSGRGGAGRNASRSTDRTSRAAARTHSPTTRDKTSGSPMTRALTSS